MLKTIIIDETQNSKEVLSSYLQKIDFISILGIFDNFEHANKLLNNIDLIIFDINPQNEEKVLEKIREIKKNKSETKLIATSYHINSNFIQKILKEGVNDFILKPILANILEASIKKITQDIKKAKSICLFSNKGGIGKTSCAINLAYEISKTTNQKTCLLDLSFNSQDISTFLNLKEQKSGMEILKHIENNNAQDIYSMLNKYDNIPLYILSTENNCDSNLKFNTKNINTLINSLKNIFDWIIIDTESEINETNISILNNCDLILLLCILSLTSIKNCQKCIELFDNLGYNSDKIKLIVNRYSENSQITIQDIEKTISKNIFSVISNNYLTLSDAIYEAKSVIETNPQSNIAKAYQNIAQKIKEINFSDLSKANEINYNHGIYNLLKKMGE